MLARRGGRLLGMLLVATLAGCPGACPPTPAPPPTPTPTPAPAPLPPPQSGDIVVALSESNGMTLLLLYSGMRQGSCVEFEQYVATDEVELKDVSYDPACPPEIDVFVQKRMAVSMAADPAVPDSERWFTDALAGGTLTLSLESPTRLPLRLWVVADGNDIDDAQAMRDRLLDSAYPLLDAMATGFTLDTATTLLKTGVIATDCAAANTIAATAEGYDPDRINVYFVPDYRGKFTTPAMNCAKENHREIIFIVWRSPWVQDPLLVHELGHALGLILPTTRWGHTFLVTPDFKAGNFMWEDATIDNVSVGQLYAMNFSIDSWLNADGSAFARPVIRTCPDSWSLADRCPALNAFAAGWPP